MPFDPVATANLRAAKSRAVFEAILANDVFRLQAILDYVMPDDLSVSIVVHPQRDPVQLTPLMFAAFHGRVECVQCLLRNGADPTRRDVWGWTALSYAFDGESERSSIFKQTIDVHAKGVDCVNILQPYISNPYAWNWNRDPQYAGYSIANEPCIPDIATRVIQSVW